jgi:hypothetical protein
MPLRDPADADFTGEQVSAEVLTRTDGVMLVLFSTTWRLESFQRDNPDTEGVNFQPSLTPGRSTVAVPCLVWPNRCLAQVKIARAI